MNKNVTWYKQRLDRGLPIFFNGGQKTNSKQKSSSSSPGWRLAVWMLNPSSGHWPRVYLPQPRSQYIYGALTVRPSKHPDLLRSSLSKNSIRNTLNDKKIQHCKTGYNSQEFYLLCQCLEWSYQNSPHYVCIKLSSSLNAHYEIHLTSMLE